MESAPSPIRPSPVSDTGGGASDSAHGSPASGAGGRRLSLLWWLFLANGAVLFVVFLLLVLSPIEIDAPVTLEQLALLLGGLALSLALAYVLLRRVLSPLFALTDVMTSIDPDSPGRPLEGLTPLSAEGAALYGAFDAMLERLETSRREASRTALAAQEAERARVARELHDEIGQTLTAVLMHAERAAVDDPSLAPAELVRVSDAVRDSLDEVRRIARELRPEALDDLGLVNALIALCSRIDAQGGLRVRRELAKPPPLPSDVELVLYRVAQESLTNVLRHAEADTAVVSLAAGPDAVTLSVEDDGKGMPGELPTGTAGLAGMRERALLVGGRLSVKPRPGGGTQVRLTVPLAEEAPCRSR